MKIGKFLFRYRSFFPVPYFSFLLIVIKFSWGIYLLGSSIIIVGLFIRFLSQGYAGVWMRGNKISGDYILDKGSFSIMRHPLYFGNFLIGFGFTLCANFYENFLLPIYSFIFFLYYLAIILEEERYLERKFREEFLEYKKRVPAFFPEVWKWRSGKFSKEQGLKMEKSTHLTILLTYLIFLLRGFLI